MELVKTFEQIRDIPYKIPLTYEEEDNCCTGKSKKLLGILKSQGYKARYRVCAFLWKDLPLPEEVAAVGHDKDCTHTYLEVYLGNKWVKVDLTWNKKLKNVFPINNWDGKSDTKIAVNPIKTFSTKKSAKIMDNQSKEVIEEDLARNREFYSAFNKWLESIRENDNR